MKKIFFFILFAIIAFTGCNTSSPKAEMPSPESLGVSSQAIIDFIDALEKTRCDDVHSFILMRHGKIAAQGWWNPYNPESPHMLFSLSKSFTSTAIGIAQAEGLLSINDKVISFFPDKTPENPSQNLQSMRIRDLLRMSTGHNTEPSSLIRQDTADWVKGFLASEVEHKPGTHFVYNSAGTFMLSAIMQKVTGQTLLEYLTPRLFEPLGIENPSWEKAPGGINVGGWGLKVRTKDIARFGQLYLQKGMWEGKQLIPAAWVEEASSLQTSNGSNPDSDWDQGYGYQFWRCRHNLYRGDGAFGQFCIVFPDHDAVLAITSGSTDMGAIMNLVWDKLLPGLNEKPLEENKEAFVALQSKLSTLSMSLVKGETTSTHGQSISKQTYVMKLNDEGVKEMEIDLTQDMESLSLLMEDKTMSIPLGFGSFRNGAIPAKKGAEEVVSSCAAWISPDSLQVRTFLFETPFYYTYTIAFKGDEVSLRRNINVSMGPGSGIELKGTKKY